jgi:hypothetical protein
VRARNHRGPKAFRGAFIRGSIAGFTSSDSFKLFFIARAAQAEINFFSLASKIGNRFSGFDSSYQRTREVLLPSYKMMLLYLFFFLLEARQREENDCVHKNIKRKRFGFGGEKIVFHDFKRKQKQSIIFQRCQLFCGSGNNKSAENSFLRAIFSTFWRAKRIVDSATRFVVGQTGAEKF